MVLLADSFIVSEVPNKVIPCLHLFVLAADLLQAAINKAFKEQRLSAPFDPNFDMTILSFSMLMTPSLLCLPAKETFL
jgi:hypothetical protein